MRTMNIKNEHKNCKLHPQAEKVFLAGVMGNA